MVHMMSNEQKDKRKVITVRGVTRIRNNDFLNELFAAFEEGYRPAPKGAEWTADAPIFKNNRKTVTLYPKGYEVPKPNGTIIKEKDEMAESNAALISELEEEAKLEGDSRVTSEPQDETEPLGKKLTVKERIVAETRKVPLLTLAKELSIEIPEDKKNPAAIKQFLLNATAE